MSEQSNIVRLTEYWKEQGITLAEGVGEDELREFEIPLPSKDAR